MRPGYITITNTTANNGGMAGLNSNASVIVTDGVHTYTFGIVCDTQTSCGVPPTDTFAFNLGSSFSVEEMFSVSYSISNTADQPGIFYDSAIAFISFSLSEANGAPVGTNLAPEPTTLPLFGLPFYLSVFG